MQSSSQPQGEQHNSKVKVKLAKKLEDQFIPANTFLWCKADIHGKTLECRFYVIVYTSKVQPSHHKSSALHYVVGVGWFTSAKSHLVLDQVASTKRVADARSIRIRVISLVFPVIFVWRISCFSRWQLDVSKTPVEEMIWLMCSCSLLWITIYVVHYKRVCGRNNYKPWRVVVKPRHTDIENLLTCVYNICTTLQNIFVPLHLRQFTEPRCQ